MEVPNLMRGSMYPSSRVARCPRFHRCIISNKCQNYDQHQHDCQVCESRVVSAMNQPMVDVPLGGILPEGKYVPDLQDAIKTISEAINRPLAHPDAEEQSLGNHADIVDKLEKQRKAADILARFQTTGILKMTEQIVEARKDPSAARLLGRIQ